ncbi:uncharacterized protein LOC124178253 [Neodiprion fabricii]|uniref:uncharacterized protein LOC124178253 n=1 Tax=Neodiprion fabricii TaxID=2872261 RepID=UPI001ED8DA9A|nr:uncharacterized protein LOC124178253 [Neodiprion fabricii]
MADQGHREPQGLAREHLDIHTPERNQNNSTQSEPRATRNRQTPTQPQEITRRYTINSLNAINIIDAAIIENTHNLHSTQIQPQESPEPTNPTQTYNTIPTPTHTQTNTVINNQTNRHFAGTDTFLATNTRNTRLIQNLIDLGALPSDRNEYEDPHLYSTQSIHPTGNQNTTHLNHTPNPNTTNTNELEHRQNTTQMLQLQPTRTPQMAMYTGTEPGKRVRVDPARVEGSPTTNTNTSETVAPTTDNNRTESRFHIRIEIHGHEFNALIDTGATHLYLGAEVIQILHNTGTPIDDTPDRTATMGNGTQVTIGGAVTLPIRLEPLTRLLKKDQKWHWGEEQENATNTIKHVLTSPPTLACPDYTQTFTLQTDASGTGIGAVLTQSLNDEEHVVAYASRALSEAERKYSTTERECLAVIWSIKKSRPYVEGYHLKVITDHHALKWLRELKNPTGRLARWALELLEYDFDITHRKGTMHDVPDALSRRHEDEEYIETIEDTTDKWYTYKKTQTRQTDRKHVGPTPEIIAIIANLQATSTLDEELQAERDKYMIRRAHQRTNTDETEASTSTHQPHITHQTAPHKTHPSNTPDTDTDTDPTTSTADTVIHIETTHTTTQETQTTDDDTDNNTDTTSLNDTDEQTQTPQPTTHTTRDTEARETEHDPKTPTQNHGEATTSHKEQGTTQKLTKTHTNESQPTKNKNLSTNRTHKKID